MNISRLWRFSASLSVLACVSAISAVEAQTAVNPPASGTVAAAPSSTGSGQEPGSQGAADIVVTAQRRTEKAQDVPIAISIASGSQLARQQVSQLSELSRSLAGVQFSPTPGGSGGGAYIRGLGTFARTRAAEPSVGIVVDGVVQGLVNTSQLSDISRVELLRGPQGTLFGQSVSAGVVNITTNAPDPSAVSGFFESELSGNAFAGSNYGRQLLRGAINVPASDSSAVRFNYYGVRTNGIVHNTYNGENDVQTEAGFRARYMGKFADKVTVNLIADYGYDNLDNGGFQEYYYVKPGTKTAALLGQCGVAASWKNLDHCSDAYQNQLNRTYGFSGQVDVDLGSWTATSITAYRKKYSETHNDIDRFPQALAPRQQQSGSTTDYNQFTQELRLTSDPTRPFSVTVGGFYLRSNVDAAQGPAQQAYGSSRSATGVSTYNGVQQYSHDHAESISGFGEARYKIGAFTAFGGLRYTDLTLHHFDSRQQTLPIVGALLADTIRYHDNALSWRAGVQYKPLRAVMLYGTVAKGYKGAQVAPIASAASPAYVVRPERPTDFELGAKTNLLNNRLALNLNGFYTRVKDYQGTNCPLDSITGVPTCQAVNIPRVISKGIEADIFGRIGRHLTLNGSFTYNIIRYPGNYRATNGDLLSGQQLAYAPKYRGVVSAEYTVPLRGDLQSFLSVDANYKSRTRLGTDTGDNIEVYHDRAIVDASVGLEVSNAWRVSVFVNNITNEPDPQSVSVLLSQTGDPANVAYGALQTGASLRRVGIQGRLSF